MQNLNVNITPDNYPQSLYYSQNDVGREFKINITDFTIPVGATVKIQATKPSGFGFSVAGTVSGNSVTFETTDEMTDEAGRFPAELVIESGAVVIGTANFLMVGEMNPHPEGTTDGSQGTIIPELTLLVERVEAAASSVLDMQVVAQTLPAGSQASYSYDEDLNKATFGIPEGQAGAGAAGVVASAYSAAKTYKVGDYVLYNSNLYRCTTAITTAEAWTAAHWTQIVLADDVTDLKTDFNGLLDGKAIISFPVIANEYPTLNGFSPYLNWNRSDYIPVTEGETIYIVNPKATADNVWYNSSKVAQSKFTIPIGNPATVVVPSGISYMVISNSSAQFFGDVYRDVKGLVTAEAFAPYASAIEEIESDLNTKLPFISKKTETQDEGDTQISFPNVGAISDSDGSFNPTETAYNTSDYISLDGVTGIYRTGTTTMFALWAYAFYDENKTLLGFKATTTDYTIETYDGKQVTWLDIDDYPSAKYIRITIQPTRPYTYYTVGGADSYLYDLPAITIKGTSPLPFYGKKIVNFGDSIFGNFRDTNETTDKSISKMIAEATGATVYNCGFGGCRMGYHSEGWRAFSMYSLADAITTGVWTEQDSAIASPPTGLPEYFADTLALLKSIDFTTIDYITIGYGVNDYTGNAFINYASGLEEYQYFKGALAYSLRTILNTYPNIRIIVITPCWMWIPDADGAYDYSSDDNQSENTRGYKLTDYVQACEEICEEYHIPCINTYNELGFNQYSYTAYFNVKGIDGATVSDGTHPKQAGRQLRADRIIGQMESLY